MGKVTVALAVPISGPQAAILEMDEGQTKVQCCAKTDQHPDTPPRALSHLWHPLGNTVGCPWQGADGGTCHMDQL